MSGNNMDLAQNRANHGYHPRRPNLAIRACGYGPLIRGLVCSIFLHAGVAGAAELTCAQQFPAANKIIKLGMSTALSGPNQYLGLSMSQGVKARIDEANCTAVWRKQGIQFELIVLDDNYDPQVAARNTSRLIDEHQVVALVGNVGTPTAEKSWQIANEKQVVFYGAYTGANLLRLNPPAPFVFNYRPSYDQEMEAVVADIVARGIPIKSIGLFLQNDSFGNAGLASLRKALEKICGACQDDVFQMRYERNSLATNLAVQAFIAVEEKPRAVILAGSLEPSAEFIRFAQRLSPATRFYCLSFISPSALQKKLAQGNFQLTSSQVVPQANLLAVNDQEQPLATAQAQTNEVYREGYLETQLLLEAIAGIKGTVTSENLRASLARLEKQLPGNPGDQQMMNNVWLAQLYSNNQPVSGVDASVK